MQHSPAADVEQMREKVNESLREIRGYMQNDDGDVEVVEVRPPSYVKVKVVGGCAHCTTNKAILHYSIRQAITRWYPDVEVEIIESADPDAPLRIRPA